MFDSQIVERVGWALIHSVWQLILIANLLAMANRLFFRGSPGNRYASCCVALVAMVVLPATTFLLFGPSRPAELLAAAPGQPLLLSGPEPNQDTFGGLAFQPTNAIVLSASEDALAATTPASSVLGAFRGEIVDRLQPHLGAIVLFWLTGVVVLSLRPMAGLYTVRRLRTRGTSRVPQPIENAVRDTARRMGITRSMDVAESVLVRIPSVIGFIRPMLLLPGSAVTGLTAAQLESVIAHELAHVRRHDYLINLFQTIIETVLFYHPAIWWVSNQIRREREHCCDDVAVGIAFDRATYANALVRLDQLKASVPLPAVAANGGSLLQRIQRIAQAPQHPTRTPSVWLANMAVGATLVISMATGLAGQLDARDTSAENAGTQTTAGAQDSGGGQPEGGVLTGRFVYTGKRPDPVRIRPAARQYWNGTEWVFARNLANDDLLNKYNVADESLEVGPNGGIANVLVWVRSKNIPVVKPRGNPADKSVIRLVEGRFVPHVLAIESNRTLVVKNEHAVGMNWLAQPVINQPFNVLVRANSSFEAEFATQDPLPARMQSAIHPWMTGWLLIRDNPYFAISGKDGRFRIAKLPPGTWEFQFWHERIGLLKTEHWPKGRLTLRIDREVQDLGTIRLTPEQLNAEPGGASLGGSKSNTKAAPQSSAGRSGTIGRSLHPILGNAWFRPAPFPGLGFLAIDQADQLIVKMAAYPRAQREFKADDHQRAVLKQLAIWSGEDIRRVKQPEQRTAIWKQARLRIERLLQPAQWTRLNQLVIQQRRQDVFLHPELLPDLQITADQSQRIKQAWLGHIARVNRYKAEEKETIAGLKDRKKRVAITAERVRKGQESFRQFWDDLFKILTDDQRAAYRLSRGEPVSDQRAVYPSGPVINGLVGNTDDSGRLLEITVGGDDGVHPGMKFAVFRDRTYLGEIVVVSVQPDKSVAQAVKERRRGEIKSGDRVANSATASTGAEKRPKKPE